MPAVRLRRWTRDEVLALIDQNPLQSPRWEVVDGELFVTPSPGPFHQRAVVVQPDVYVVPIAESRRLRTERTGRNLLLAVEVLSPGSERGDRGRKRALYRRTVPFYWLIDVEERHLEQWRMGETRGSVHTDRLEWRPSGAPTPFLLDLKDFCARVHGETT